MANEYFTPDGVPATGAFGASSAMRNEFALIQSGFDKLPALAANANKIVVVNSAGTAMSAVGTVGSGSVVLQSGVTLSSATLSAGTISGATITGGTIISAVVSAAMGIANGATLNVSAGASATVAAGGTETVSGTLAIANGGSAVISNGGNFNVISGGNLTVANNANMVISATPVFSNGLQIASGPLQVTRTAGIIAHSGGGQASATALSAAINIIATVSAAGDSVILPSGNSIAGGSMVVTNAAAANSASIFPHAGDSINALSPNTAFGLAANKTAIFYCYTSAGAGFWNSILTA